MFSKKKKTRDEGSPGSGSSQFGAAVGAVVKHLSNKRRDSKKTPPIEERRSLNDRPKHLQCNPSSSEDELSDVDVNDKMDEFHDNKGLEEEDDAPIIRNMGMNSDSFDQLFTQDNRLVSGSLTQPHLPIELDALVAMVANLAQLGIPTEVLTQAVNTGIQLAETSQSNSGLGHGVRHVAQQIVILAQ
jgi:hypothetical protein